MTETEARIREAIDGLLAEDERPTVRGIRAWLIDRDGEAPSFREVTPALRRWREAHRGRRTVASLVERYHALDPEQKAEFRELTGL